jgi:hypothetical protein
MENNQTCINEYKDIINVNTNFSINDIVWMKIVLILN